MMSGSDPRMLEAEHRAGAADAGLDLVEDQQDAALPRQGAQVAQEVAGGLEDAGLALDRLQHDGDGARRDRGLDRGQVVQRAP